MLRPRNLPAQHSQPQQGHNNRDTLLALVRVPSHQQLKHSDRVSKAHRDGAQVGAAATCGGDAIRIHGFSTTSPSPTPRKTCSTTAESHKWAAGFREVCDFSVLSTQRLLEGVTLLDGVSGDSSTKRKVTRNNTTGQIVCRWFEDARHDAGPD